MAVVKGPGGELGGDDLLVTRLHLVPGHVEHGLELAGEAEEAILLERRTAHRHPGRAQLRQMLGDGLGELRRQGLCHDFCLDGLARLPQAFQVADLRVGDGLPDEFLQAPAFKKELLGIGAHPKARGHREPQPGEVAQFLGLAAVKEAFPHLGQGQRQGRRLQLGPDQFLRHQVGHLPAGGVQGGIAATGHAIQGPHHGLDLLAQPVTGLPDIVHVKQEPFIHLDLDIGHGGQNSAVGRQEALILEIAFQEGGRGPQGYGRRPRRALASQPLL